MKGGLNTYSYVYNNPVNVIDPTGTLAVAGSICTAVAAADTISSLDSLADMLENINSIDDQIETLENSCPIEEQPDWYRQHIERLQRERRQAVADYVHEQRYSLARAGGLAILCAIAWSPLIPF